MQYLILILALITGAAAGAVILRILSLKNLRSITGERDALKMKNIEMQTTITAQQQQYEVEKQLLKESFEREKRLLDESHSQKLKMLQQHHERSFSELEKTHQARLAQLKEECNALSNKILEEKYKSVGIC